MFHLNNIQTLIIIGRLPETKDEQEDEGLLFSSMIFLWVFLPSVILGNFLLSKIPFGSQAGQIRAKNRFLLIASLIFYGWGGIYYLLLMFASITLNYTGGWLLTFRCKSEKGRKGCLAAVVAINILLLFIFKYFNMFVILVENIMDPGRGSILHMVGTGALGIPEIVLPIGISFFTFQAMSYVIDVYRRKVPVQKNYLDFALYVSFFPQLIAGPIVRYNEVEKQIYNRTESDELRAEGIKRFCYGLGKKVLLANTFAVAADQIWASPILMSGLVAWLGALCYTLQIYYDFSGYSDMAIGLGRMFGFKFAENFNYPYISASVQEFWRRWHISLSTWFREYVYIPLGGNRKGKGRTLLNLFIVFLLTGIWHGANYTFFAWGIYYAILLIIERLFLGKLLERNPLRFINHIYTILAVMIGWILFRSVNIFQARDIIKGLFVFGPNDANVLSYLSMRLCVCIIAGILLCGPVQSCLRNWYEAKKLQPAVQRTDFAIQLILLCLSVLSLIGGSYNPFIYFQF